ncbi:MAG: hypothetical protein U9O82_02830, partial [Thermodesulfobacteriota bacterium]|nr:hypothetical protein [Thermodesulfobacteriota bacterium]
DSSHAHLLNRLVTEPKRRHGQTSLSMPPITHRLPQIRYNQKISSLSGLAIFGIKPNIYIPRA